MGKTQRQRENEAQKEEECKSNITFNNTAECSPLPVMLVCRDTVCYVLVYP